MFNRQSRTRFVILATAFFIISIAAITASAQLTGIKAIPGDYADLAAAIADLNTQGVGAGGVTFNLTAGNPQIAPAGGYVIGDTGSLVLTTASAPNPIVFNGNGNTITANGALTAGQLFDGIFKLIGADWTTINGFVMTENAANITTAAGTNNMTEWGVALLYATATDGAQNNTITGNTIDLNRTYQNTFGIYSNSTHSPTAVTTSATATGVAGSNAPLTVTANNITDVNLGIVVVGPTSAADHNDGLTIGGTAPNANTLTNYGTTGTFSGYANVSATVYGIMARNTKNCNVSFNNITSSSGAGGVTGGTLRGIYVPNASNQPIGTFTNNINNNTLAVTSHVLGGTLQGITVEGTTSSPSSTTNINNNNFTTLNHTIAAATGTITAISQSGSAAAGPVNHSISNNTFTNITSSSTGSFTFISNNWTRPAGGIGNVNNNSIVTGFNKTGAGNTLTLYNSNGSSGPSVTEINNGNNFQNVTASGGTTIAGWVSSDSSLKTITGNTFSNWTGGGAAITGLLVSFSAFSDVSNNTVSSITGNGVIAGIITGTGTGTENISRNTVHTITGSGIQVAGGNTKNIFRNKIYGVETGIFVSFAAIFTNIYNNLIGASSTGLNSAANNPSSSIIFSFNSIYVNSAGSADTSGISHSSDTVSTTATLVMRSNNIVNASTPTGSGRAIAFRTNDTPADMANYAGNNNNFYAGAPGSSHLIFYDGTNSLQTIGDYKNAVAPRDSASISEDPPFLTTDPAHPNFLHINPAATTQLESGGTPVLGITDDFDGNTRNASTPDIGADEFASPTAANAFVAGRVTTASGQGIVNAMVTISGGSLPATRTVYTGSLGWYTFNDLEVGHTYIVTVSAKRFRFSTGMRVIQLFDNVTDADFTANP